MFNEWPENRVLQQLRDNDLVNPAPFTHRTLIVMDNFGALEYEKPSGFYHPSAVITSPPVFEDVPIDRILGISCSGHLGDYAHPFVPGTTFREVLFEYLHGAGLNQESLAFLVGAQPKDQEMPQDRYSNLPKLSRGGIRIRRYGDWYIVINGQQRGIVAMYGIWQNGGTCLLNALVECVKCIP